LHLFRSLEPPIRRNLLVLFTVGLLFWASLAALLPTLSLYLKSVGATNQQVGVVMGAFAVGLVLFRPPLGQLADQRGRKPVLLIGLFAVAIAPLGYMLTQSIPLLAAVRIFHGLSIAAFTTAYSALVVDVSPPDKRGEVIGYMSLVNPIGVAIGPALGGYVQEWAGYDPLFWVSAGLGLLGLIGGTQINARSASSELPHLTEAKAGKFWRLLSSPRLRIPAVLMLLVGLAFGTLSTFVPLFIQETRINFNAGLFYTAAAIASFGVRLLTGRASDRHGRGQFVSIGLICYAIAMFLLWQAQSEVAFLLAGLMEGSGSGIFLPTMIALMADRSHPQERGRVFGLCMGGFDLGMAIAGPVLGTLADSTGYRALFGLAGMLVLMALATFTTLGSKSFNHSLKFALGQEDDLYALPRPKEL
jgi:MFS family permease